MDDRVHAAQRLTLKVTVAEARQIAQSDLDVDAVAPQTARIASQGTHVVPGPQQQR
jgi:hypothetical protein